MAEYIEREALIAEIQKNIHTYCSEGSGGYYLAEDALNYSVKTAPTADVVPKSEVENIFAEIETCMKDFEDDDDGYLLKKCEFEFFMREIKEKYAEQKND